jgi:hypothetical protein
MQPHFEQQGDVRHFVHAGTPVLPRLLDCEVAESEELRIVLAPGTNVGQTLLEVLSGRRYCSAVGRLLSGGASHLAYHRMVVTTSEDKPYDYGAPVVLDGYITFVSGAITVGRDAEGKTLLHCHAGFIDREGEQHGGHLVLDRIVVGNESLVVRLCLFEHVAYQVKPDEETHFNLLHPVLQEAV